MKLFGGGGSRKGKKSTADMDLETSAPKAPKSKGTRKKTKKQLTAAQKKKRRIIGGSVTAAVLLMVVAVAALANAYIRPPTNDPTIKDPENGDAVDLLNSGDRIGDVFTFVVCATDEEESRTDAIMVATMDVTDKTINVMNIPRDTMSNITSRSGAGRKINAAYGTKKGIEQTKAEVELLMGFVPDKYIVVNFDGIAEIVDAIGGLEYEVPFRMKYDDPSQDLHIDLYAGLQLLTGKQTVEFLRWRKNNSGVSPSGYVNGDEGRVENQQKFLKALAAEVLQMKNITKIKTIADTVFKNVTTDFTAGEILWMAMQSLQIDNDDIQMFTLPGYGAMSTAGTSEAFSFYFPYYNETLELVNEYFNPFTTKITTLSIVSGPTVDSSSSSSSGNYTVNDEDDYTWSNSLDSSGVLTDDTDQTGNAGAEGDVENGASGEGTGGEKPSETESHPNSNSGSNSNNADASSGEGTGSSTGSNSEGDTTTDANNTAGQSSGSSEGAQSTTPSTSTGSSSGSDDTSSSGSADPEA